MLHTNRKIWALAGGLLAILKSNKESVWSVAVVCPVCSYCSTFTTGSSTLSFCLGVPLSASTMFLGMFTFHFFFSFPFQWFIGISTLFLLIVVYFQASDRLNLFTIFLVKGICLDSETLGVQGVFRYVLYVTEVCYLVHPAHLNSSCIHTFIHVLHSFPEMAPCSHM